MSVGTDSIKRAVVKKTETEKKKTGKKPSEAKSSETKSSVIPKAAETTKTYEADNKVYRVTDELPFYLL